MVLHMAVEPHKLQLILVDQQCIQLVEASLVDWLDVVFSLVVDRLVAASYSLDLVLVLEFLVLSKPLVLVSYSLVVLLALHELVAEYLLAVESSLGGQLALVYPLVAESYSLVDWLALESLVLW